MSTQDWRQAITRTAAPARITDIAKYIAVKSANDPSPIDIFYSTATEILRIADPMLLVSHPSLGPLMLVGMVSATENYFRDIFARIISICPLAKESSANQSISLGTVLFHDGILPARGAFENLSFTAANNLKSTCKTYLNYDVKSHGAFDSALLEYEKICELRHGVAHSGAVLSGKNALKLQLRRLAPHLVRKAPHLRVTVGFAEIQECADVCATLAVSANGELFAMMIERWAKHWRRHLTWQDSRSFERFKEVWSIFRSEIDATNNQIPCPLTARACCKLIRNDYGI